MPVKELSGFRRGGGIQNPNPQVIPPQSSQFPDTLESHSSRGETEIFPTGMGENNNGSVCFKDYCRGLQNRIQSNSSINFSDKLHFASRQSFESSSLNRGNKFPSRKGGYYIEDLGSSIEPGFYNNLFLVQKKTGGFRPF